MTTRQALVLRGAAASAVATVVAALSHAWAGGALPAALLVVAMAVLLVPAGMALMGSRPRRGRIAASVLLLQGLFHAVFSLLGAPVASAQTTGGHHHGIAVGAGPGSGVVAAETAGASVIDGGGMLLAHVFAAVVTFAMLAYGERAILAVLAWVVEWVQVRATAPTSPAAPKSVAPSHVRVLVARRAATSVLVRGPPVLSV